MYASSRCENPIQPQEEAAPHESQKVTQPPGVGAILDPFPCIYKKSGFSI